jgi:hypothetical protein
VSEEALKRLNEQTLQVLREAAQAAKNAWDWINVHAASPPREIPTRPYLSGDGTTAPEPGWEWGGPDPPGGPRGGWTNPNNPGESLHSDFGHGGKIRPHWIGISLERDGRIFPDGTVKPK